MSYHLYLCCVVPDCKITSIRTPGKLWIKVLTDLNMRNTWLKLARRDPKALSTKSKLYFCEDHFDGQAYEDKRCRCVCPSPAAVLNSSLNMDRKMFTDYVPPNKCNCYGVILPRMGEEIIARAQEFCPRCECKYETRNTTIIMVVVIIVLWVIMLLVVYLVFLMCLDPLINKKRVKQYMERDTEEAQNLLLNEDVE